MLAETNNKELEKLQKKAWKWLRDDLVIVKDWKTERAVFLAVVKTCRLLKKQENPLWVRQESDCGEPTDEDLPLGGKGGVT